MIQLPSSAEIGAPRVLRRDARGAAFIEYLLICGILALGLIMGFKRLRAAGDDKLARQGDTVRTFDSNPPGPQLRPAGGGVMPVSLGATPGGKKRVSLTVLNPTKCFAAGTPVATEDGERPIEQVRLGDRVWGRDEATGEDKLAPVVERHVTEQAPVIGIHIPFDVGKSELIRVTPEHPFWVDRVGWIAAQDLNGLALSTLARPALHPVLAAQATASGAAATANNVQATALESWAEPVTVYNLEVEGLHSFFVGQARVLVHNRCVTDVQRYDQWSKDPLKPAGTEVNHLNQNAVYGTSHGGRIPYGAGASVPLTGGTDDPCSQHYKFHRSLENFWDRYREGGPLDGKVPTNREYGQALEKALIAAEIDPLDAVRIAEEARQNRLKYHYKDNYYVPHVPGAFMGKTARPCLP